MNLFSGRILLFISIIILVISGTCFGYEINNIGINDTSEIIIDCNFSLKAALNGKNIPEYIKKDLRILSVQYFSFDDKLHQGQSIIHKNLVNDLKQIFSLIKKIKFPIAKVIPIVKYNWNDEKSMEDNNTSAFNYRFVKGTNKLSYHAKGRAIDINPKLNPQVRKKIKVPKNSNYNSITPGTLFNDSPIVKEFKKLGWRWGGNWRSVKDYQHFEKR